MSLEGIDLDETGPPPIEIGMTLADVVRKVNSAGASLDQVVIAGTEEVYLDWAKNWLQGEELTEEEKALPRDELIRRREEHDRQEAEQQAESERRDAENEEMMDDPTRGW